MVTGNDVKIVANAFGDAVEVQILLNEVNGLCHCFIAVEKKGRIVSFAHILNDGDGVLLFKTKWYDETRTDQIRVFKSEGRWFCEIPERYEKFLKQC